VLCTAGQGAQKRKHTTRVVQHEAARPDRDVAHDDQPQDTEYADVGDFSARKRKSSPLVS